MAVTDAYADRLGAGVIGPRNPGPLVEAASTVGVLVLAVIVALAVSRTIMLVREAHAIRGEIEVATVFAAVVGVVVSLLLLSLSTPRLDVLSVALPGMTVGLLAAVASVGYERSQSVWVPMLVFTVSGILMDSAISVPLMQLFS